MATGDAVFNSDGQAVDVSLLYTVKKGQLAVVDEWIGITGASGDSGENIALIVDDREWQFVMPATLDVSKGDIVYLDVDDLTGHTPDSTAYSTSAASGSVALFKATSDQDDNNVVTGILLAKNALAG